MKNLTHHLASIAITLWVGSLWAIGYLAVPVLFHAQPDKQLAGMLAGQMFSVTGYIGLICSLYLLGYYAGQSGRAALRQRPFQFVAAMLLITLVFQYYFQPVMAELKVQALPLDVMQSRFSGQFKMLHGLSSIVYLIESLLGIFLVILNRR